MYLIRVVIKVENYVFRDRLKEQKRRELDTFLKHLLLYSIFGFEGYNEHQKLGIFIHCCIVTLWLKQLVSHELYTRSWAIYRF